MNHYHQYVKGLIYHYKDNGKLQKLSSDQVRVKLMEGEKFLVIQELGRHVKFEKEEYTIVDHEYVNPVEKISPTEYRLLDLSRPTFVRLTGCISQPVEDCDTRNRNTYIMIAAIVIAMVLLFIIVVSIAAISKPSSPKVNLVYRRNLPSMSFESLY